MDEPAVCDPHEFVVRPRVSWCSFTRKWIVNQWGDRHTCQPYSLKAEIAFRRWHDAMEEANRIWRDAAAAGASSFMTRLIEGRRSESQG